MPRRPYYLLCLIIALLGAGSLLGGCGQKGDLYLPDPGTEQSSEKQG